MPHLASRLACGAACLSPQGVANACWALSACRHESPPAMAALLSALRAKAHLMRPGGLASAAMAFAGVGQGGSGCGNGDARRAVALVAAAAVARLSVGGVSVFPPRALANVAWACAAVGCARSADCSAIRDALHAPTVWATLTPSEAAQAWQAEAAAEAERAEAGWAFDGGGDDAEASHAHLPSTSISSSISSSSSSTIVVTPPAALFCRLLDRASARASARRAWAAAQASDAASRAADRPSAFQRSVAAAAARLAAPKRAGDEHSHPPRRDECAAAASPLSREVVVKHRPSLAAEHQAADLYSVDVAFPGARVGIEADGPSHFTANTRVPMGATRLKRRLMGAAGWRIASVPFWEWDALKGDEAAEDAYLKDALVAAGAGDLVASLEEDAAAAPGEGARAAAAAPPVTTAAAAVAAAASAAAGRSAARNDAAAVAAARSEALVALRARSSGAGAGALLRGVVAVRAAQRAAAQQRRHAHVLHALWRGGGLEAT